MGMVVRTNTMSINAYRQLGLNNNAVAKSLEKLASGYRINRAGDDAAGLAISEKMKAQITGLETASANAQDGISLIQTAEGNLNEVHDMLNRMVELATKSANGTYTTQERKALQDEVDQLLKEIDRISQSANFNGTKLLDGTMGLNRDAFTSITSVSAVSGSDGKLNIAEYVAGESDGRPNVHLEGTSVSAATPSATIDLGDLSVKVEASTTGAVTITALGTTFTVTLDNYTSNAAKTFSADDIAAALRTALKTVSSNDGAATNAGADAVSVGGAVFTVGGSGSTVDLSYAGRGTGANYVKENAFSGDSSAATAINNALGYSVTAAAVTNKGKIDSGDVIHKATNVKQAAAEVKAGRAGIDIRLEDLVKEGNVLTIDGTKYIFKVNANSQIKEGTVGTGKTKDGETIIDVSTEADGNKIHAAGDLLSNKTITGQDDRTWSIGVNNNGEVIHIDQTHDSKTGKELKTYNDLLGVLGVNGQATAAKNVATQITVNAAKLVAGDAINIGGKTYTFGDGTGKVALGTNGADALTNLKAKLETDGYTDKVTVDGNTITIQAKSDTATSGPAVVGPGLTLQIGDTSEDFNKLTVKVDNMSSAALGLGDLKITTEALASDAISKIKEAINSVSTARAGMGALQNRLEHTINNLDVAAENLSSANSRIRDTDMAKEMMNYTKMNVLVQSAQAMLAQANQQPQSVLQLLQ